MNFSKEQFEEIFKLVCPNCAAGHTPTWRPDTAEYIHARSEKLDQGMTRGTVVTTTYCLATNARKAAEAQETPAPALSEEAK